MDDERAAATPSTKDEDTPQLFRFVPQWGGHAGDSDELVCHVRWDTSEELLALLRACGAEPEPLPEGHRDPQAGEVVTEDTVWSMAGAPGYRSVAYGEVLGVRVYFGVRVLAEGSVLELALFGADGDPWAVTAADWHDAAVVERELLARGLDLRRGDWLERWIEGGPETWSR